MPAAQPYAHIARLMADWFHQDFDLIAPTWQGVIDAYREAAPREERAALGAEIELFIAGQGSDPARVGKAFQAEFSPEVMTTHFAPTTLAFLQALLARIQD